MENQGEVYAPYNFSWVVPKKLAGMGWPQSVANLKFLVREGISQLVTLSPERKPPILEGPKLKWTHIPIKEFQVPTMKQILKFIDVCQRAEIKQEVVGVHCRQGHGRTGVMLAVYLVHFHRMAPERAVLTIKVQRPGSFATIEHESIVCRYHDCLRGTLKIDYRLVDSKKAFDEVYKKEDSCSPPEGDGNTTDNKEEERRGNRDSNSAFIEDDSTSVTSSSSSRYLY